MPHTSKRRTYLLNAIKIRWSNEAKNASSDESSFSMEISDEDEEGANSLSFNDTIQLCDIADIFELCTNQCHIRYLSVLISYDGVFEFVANSDDKKKTTFPQNYKIIAV